MSTVAILIICAWAGALSAVNSAKSKNVIRKLNLLMRTGKQKRAHKANGKLAQAVQEKGTPVLAGGNNSAGWLATCFLGKTAAPPARQTQCGSSRDPMRRRSSA